MSIGEIQDLTDEEIDEMQRALGAARPQRQVEVPGQQMIGRSGKPILIYE